MASRDEIFPAGDCCEICGVGLGDEVVIQEFADGSLARLCPECAAGADLDEEHRGSHKAPAGAGIVWPDEPAAATAKSATDLDPLEKTRELLMPVTDLISLQGEMQGALERLAASLERFAAEMIVDSQDKSAVENRLQMLELELVKTRSRLAEAEQLLASTGLDVAEAGTSVPLVAPTMPTLVPPPSAAPAGTQHLPAGSEEPAVVAPQPAPPVEPAVGTQEPVVPPVRPSAGGAAAPLVRPAETQGPAAPEAPAVPSDQPPNFRIDEVQVAQRYYNESAFTSRIREVRRSLGKPKANLTRLAGPEPRAIVTVAWDIVWYQYLVDLRRDLPSSVDRVTLYREGMDLDELAFHFKEKNAVVNDDGRLDASELEVKLLSDPNALITEMPDDEKHIFEDATEEVWDQHIAPEFKWDD